MQGRAKKYMLQQYFGLDKDQIKRLSKLESRATTIVKTYPQIVISEKEIHILKNMS
jgi:hypothetical protein